jgi:hypothetical protein
MSNASFGGVKIPEGSYSEPVDTRESDTPLVLFFLSKHAE